MELVEYWELYIRAMKGMVVFGLFETIRITMYFILWFILGAIFVYIAEGRKVIHEINKNNKSI
jgi:hypothetical protein